MARLQRNSPAVRPADALAPRISGLWSALVVKPGDWVVLATLPPGAISFRSAHERYSSTASGAPSPSTRSTNTASSCDVSAEIDPIFGGYMNDIRVEPDYVVPDYVVPREQWKAR